MTTVNDAAAPAPIPYAGPPIPLAEPAPLTGRQRGLVLLAAFLAWMFAGLELSMFVLAGRAAIVDILSARGGGAPAAALVGQWFTYYQGAVMLGAAAGGWTFGWLGDRFGRRRAMAWAVLCYSVMTGVSWFAGDLWTLLALRFLVGMGIGGVWPNAVSLVAEAWPNASRPFLAGLLGTAANFGFVLLGAIALVWLITPESWRWVPLVGTAPLLLGLWSLWGVPESPRWLAGRAAAVASAARGVAAAANPLAEIFRPPLLRRTVLGILLGAIPVIGTSANGNWLVFWSDAVAAAAPATLAPAAAQPGRATTAAKPKPVDARKKAMTQIQRSGGGILGSLLGGWIASLVGRRLTYFLISLFSFALSTYIFQFLHPSDAYFGLFTFLLGFMGVTYFGWLPLYLPELFPTRVRSTGTGVSFNSGRVIAAVVVLGASFLIALFAGDFARVGVWTGSIYAVGMLIICFAPSTGGKKLED